MSPNLLWTPIKFTISPSISNCYGPGSSHLEYAKIQLVSLLQTRMCGQIDLPLSSLDQWHWSVCRIIQTQNLQLFFSAGPIASSFRAETHPWSLNLSGVTTTRRIATFSNSIYGGLPIGSFSTFKGPLKFLAKTPLKCLLLYLFTFQ